MTMDEKLEFLRQSTESLHASCQELHATAVEQGRQIMAEARRSQRREWAMLTAMEAYLEALDGEEGSDGE